MRIVTSSLLRIRPATQLTRATTRSRLRLLCNQKASYVHGTKINSPSARNDPNSQKPDNVNPSYPAFSFEALGVSKNMKIFLIVILSIFGTMETWFYCQAIWRWWKGGSEAEEK